MTFTFSPNGLSSQRNICGHKHLGIILVIVFVLCMNNYGERLVAIVGDYLLVGYL